MGETGVSGLFVLRANVKPNLQICDGCRVIFVCDDLQTIREDGFFVLNRLWPRNRRLKEKEQQKRREKTHASDRNKPGGEGPTLQNRGEHRRSDRALCVAMNHSGREP